MIDTHIHADARSGEDFKEMYLAGIDSAITCSYYPYKIDSEIILLNHLNRILEYDTKRASQYGLDLKVALGIHPTNALENVELIYDELYKWIDAKQIVAIGEIGLEDLTDAEISVFKKLCFMTSLVSPFTSFIFLTFKNFCMPLLLIFLSLFL